MPVFDNSPEGMSGSDWALLHNSPVTLFWRLALLDQKTAWLRDNGYAITTLDAGSWLSVEHMHDALSRAFSFPDYYGRNLDALRDCLRDVALDAYGSSPSASGTVMVLTGYERFAGAEPRAAQVLLDAYAHCARTGLLVGHRMMLLLQTNDPAIRFGTVGACPVVWNSQEWLNSSRGL